MKILWLVDDYSGGAGNVAQLLTRELAKRGHNVTLLLTNCHTEPKYDMASVNCAQYTMNRKKTDNFLTWFRSIANRLRNYIAENDYDVVVSFLDVINIVTAFSLMNCKMPLIVCERSNPLIIKPKFPWNVLRYPAYQRANRVSVQFHAFSKLCHGAFKNKAFVTPNPIINPNMVPCAPYESGSRCVRIVTAARLEPVKQFPLLIEMFYELHAKISNIDLTILGDGTQREALQDMIDAKHLNSCIHMPGSTKEVIGKLVGYDIYVMTSQQEGFPNSLCEAMSVGLPCVAFECHQGLRDLIDDGINGFLVPQNDVIVMQTKLEALISDESLRKKIGNNAVKIVDKYSMDNIVTLWENELSTLASSFATKRHKK